jgi:hypothetical protein
MADAACVGDDPGVVPGSRDEDAAPREDGPARDSGGADVEGPGSCDLFVSTEGSDAAPGGSPRAPKRTIASAIGAAKQAGAAGRRICVCDGTYPENQLLLDHPVSIYGGYSCVDFTRGAVKADALRTIIENGGTANCTLDVRGSGIDRSVVLDGLRVRGGGSAALSGRAVCVEGASPTLTNNRFEGGTSAESATALNLNNGSPLVANNVIEGGRTTGSRPSVGLVISGGVGQTDAAASPPAAPDIHDNSIRGGAGSSDWTAFNIASLGVYIVGLARVRMTEAAGNPFARNHVSGGTGSFLGAGYAAIGLFFQGGPHLEVDLVGNWIDGGVPTTRKAGDSSKGQVALRVHATGRLHAHGNRIHGGDYLVGLPTFAAEAVAAVEISAGGAADVELTNNFIHAGAAHPATALVGLRIAAPETVVRHNTIFVDGRRGNRATHMYLAASASGTIVQNNVFAGARANEASVSLFECPVGPSLAGLEHNVFFENARGLVEPGKSLDGGPGAGSCAPLATPDAIVKDREARDASASGWTGNVRLDHSGSCTAPSCLPTCKDLTPEACLASFFGSWTPIPNTGGGIAELDAGLRLNGSGASLCAYARGGVDLTAGSGSPGVSPVPRDFYGSQRTPGVSMGAHEFDGPCKGAP